MNNNNHRLTRILFIVIALVSTVLSCNKDHTTEGKINCDEQYTFSSDSHNIQPIIQLTCAITGCHVAGEGIGDFTKYNNLKSFIANGEFENRAFDIKDMPPEDTPGPTQLTKDELDQLKCWIQNGYIK